MASGITGPTMGLTKGSTGSTAEDFGFLAGVSDWSSVLLRKVPVGFGSARFSKM